MTEAERDEFKRLQAIRMVARGATPEEIAKTIGITIVQARILWATYPKKRVERVTE